MTDKFDKEDITLIIRETRSLNAEDKGCVGRVLSKKKKKGIKIDKQAIAIALKECGQSRQQKSKSSDPDYKTLTSRKTPAIRL